MELAISSFQMRFPGSDGEPSFCLDFPGLRFPMGTVTFVLGRNGSGKSVLLRLLAGELDPTNGSVRYTLDGMSWTAKDHRRGIVRQRAEDNLALDLTVRENLLLQERPISFRQYLFPRAEFASRLHVLLDGYTELTRKLDQPARNLSVGQRQTLAYVTIARGTGRLLFLDEFLSATDSATTSKLRELTKAYAKDVPACVFVISHHVSHALEDGDRILILESGRVVADIVNGDPRWNETSLLHHMS